MLTGLVRCPDSAGAPAPEQVHLQFGADASSQVSVSWTAPAPVARPRLLIGQAATAAGCQVEAEELVYTDALTGETVFTYHAAASGLEPGSQYVYEVLHDGSPPVAGAFSTAPRGRSGPFRFTSFGDHSVPAPVGLGGGPHSANAGYVVDAVERLDPLFHLLNGDLCYANASDAPVATWASYFGNISRSARYRPWMPAPGNHENEAGNGPHGYLSYQTRFSLPGNGTPAYRGLWYAFTAGPVRVVALNNDDVCLQDGGFSGLRRDGVPGYLADGVDPYIRGYSGGVQLRWLERELVAARDNDEIDWIVVVMHQPAMSSARFNGADLGVRQHWLPVFDAYEVDLVLAGHEHHYERELPVRGTTGTSLLTPKPVPMSGSTIDTTKGTQHMIIGGGGTSAPSNTILTDPPTCYVITSVGPNKSNPGPGAPTGHFLPNYTPENAIWSSVRDKDWSYGFAAFSVDPGNRPGGQTTIEVTYYRVKGFGGELEVFDTFTLTRPRNDR